MSGWVKIHRKLLGWEWYTQKNMVQIFIHFLVKANHEKISWRGVKLNPGQFVSGRSAISAETGLSPQEVRTAITKLKTTKEITTTSTKGITVFTLLKWDDYQMYGGSSTTGKLSSLRKKTTSGSTTVKEERSKNKRKKLSDFSAEIQEDVASIIQVYQKMKLGSGGISDARVTIAKILESGEYDVDALMIGILNYYDSCQIKGLDQQYILQANNFFGQTGEYREFIDNYQQPESPHVEAMAKLDEDVHPYHTPGKFPHREIG